MEIMEHNMILSASGWRKVFAASGNEQDKSPEITNSDKALSAIAAEVFFDYLCDVAKTPCPVIALGMDTRPTGKEIALAMLHVLAKKDCVIQYTGISSAPEIMAYAKKLDGFIYISASHNPIGHNGIKFGINDGGVVNAQENAKITAEFLKRLSEDGAEEKALERIKSCPLNKMESVLSGEKAAKHNSLKAYEDFVKETVSDSANPAHQEDFFQIIHGELDKKPMGILCDFNGSSRTLCIDKNFLNNHHMNFYAMNGNPGEIVHEIIPESENLVYVAEEMERLQAAGHKDAVLGYMPDCDGDRGNIVYWDEKQSKAVILKAQEVFSLSVLAELTFSIWCHQGEEGFKPAVCVNCPTSMRIEEIAECLGASVFRGEVGEANVVNLAREKRAEGWNVRILGEGSNGGTITYPASVRDPLNTLFAIIKLLVMKESGLFEMWCKKRGVSYNPNYTLSDILETLPKYTTTGVSESRAVLKVREMDHAKLKSAFQKNFEKEWKTSPLVKKYGFTRYEGVLTNGTKETRNAADWSLSGKGGLKVIFYDKEDKPCAFIWMRGSGTEPVFRVMCDVKGDNIQMEKELLEWETSLLS